MPIWLIPIMPIAQMVVQEIIKRLYERYFTRIPNRLIPLVSIALATAANEIAGRPMPAIVAPLVGAAATAVHEVISPRLPPPGPPRPGPLIE